MYKTRGAVRQLLSFSATTVRASRRQERGSSTVIIVGTKRHLQHHNTLSLATELHYKRLMVHQTATLMEPTKFVRSSTQNTAAVLHFGEGFIYGIGCDITSTECCSSGSLLDSK